MFIALREMRRARLRFGLLGGAVGLLVFLLLFFQSVAGSLLSGLTGAVDEASADVLVYSERARGNPVASVLDPATVAGVAALDGVDSASGVGVGLFTTRVGGDAVDAVVVGVEDTTGLPRTIADGRAPSADGEVLAAASSFDETLAIGDTATVGEGGIDLDVVGTADNAAFNVQTTLYVPFPTYAEAVRARTDAPGPVPISYVVVDVADDADPVAVAEGITAALDGVEAFDRDAAVDALPGVEVVGQSFSILYALLAIVVLIVTGVFFLILTVQKRDALVLLRAVGARRRDVVTPVLLQVVVVVGLGVAVGTALASALLAAARDTFGASLSTSTVALTASGILLLGLVGASAAVRRVLRIEPVEVTTTGELVA